MRWQGRWALRRPEPRRPLPSGHPGVPPTDSGARHNPVGDGKGPLKRQPVNGGSGSPEASPGVVTAAASGAQLAKDLLRRREGSLLTLPASAALWVRNSSIFLRLAAHNKKATKTLWAATPRIRRRSGSSMASLGPVLDEAVHPLDGVPQGGVHGVPLGGGVGQNLGELGPRLGRQGDGSLGADLGGMVAQDVGDRDADLGLGGLALGARLQLTADRRCRGGGGATHPDMTIGIGSGLGADPVGPPFLDPGPMGGLVDVAVPEVDGGAR